MDLQFANPGTERILSGGAVMKRLLTIVATFIFPAVCLAESGLLGFGEPLLTRNMETDRPDFTEGYDNR